MRKLLISVLLIYHLIVCTVLANSGSFLGRKLSPYLLPYGNTFGINSTWNFFSPDPAHVMYYEAKFYRGESLISDQSLELPAQRGRAVMDMSQRRWLYAVRYLVIDPTRLKTLMGPWLCRKYSGIDKVHMESIFSAIPNLDQAVLNGEKSISEMQTESTISAEEVSCPEPSSVEGSQ